MLVVGEHLVKNMDLLMYQSNIEKDGKWASAVRGSEEEQRRFSFTGFGYGREPSLFCTSGVSCGLAEDKDVIFVTRYTFNPFPVTPSK